MTTDEDRAQIRAKIADIMADPARTQRTVMAAVLTEHALTHPEPGENPIQTALATLRGGMINTADMKKALDHLQAVSDRMDEPA